MVEKVDSLIGYRLIMEYVTKMIKEGSIDVSHNVESTTDKDNSMRGEVQ